VEQVLRAQDAGVGVEVVPPACAGRERRQGVGDAAHDDGAHLVEQFLLVADVPVQSGGLHVEPGGERTDGDALHALLVEQLECRRHDPLPRDALRHA
jgi:hypothetical protein